MKFIFPIFILLSALTGKAQSCTPIGGIAYSNICAACPSDTLMLDDSGATASGVAYQWQYSSDSIVWSDIADATTIPYSFTPTGKYHYRCIIACPEDSSYSSTIQVYYESSCPCFPQYAAPNPSIYWGMQTFILNGSSDTYIRDSDNVDSFGFINKTCRAPYIIMGQGMNYTGIIYSSYDYDYTWENQIWIDFDDNGVFDVSEAITALFSTDWVNSVNFTLHIPSSANIGLHRMRVRNVQLQEIGTGASNMTPCGSYDSVYYDTTLDYFYYYWGNTFDYLVKIDTPINTGVASINSFLEIRLFPNPAQNNVVIQIPFINDNDEATIYDITGREILKQQINSEKTIINVAMLREGLYYVYLKNGAQTTVMKFLKT